MIELPQKQQEILNNLRWEYDKDSPYVPWEYMIIEWNKDNKKELKDFADMIYYSDKTENYIVLDNEPSEIFTCIKRYILLYAK